MTRHKKATECEDRRVRKGFSLIEVIMAMAILVMGLVGIMNVFPSGLRASKKAGDISKGTFLATEKIEEARLIGLENMESLSGESGKLEWELSEEDMLLDGLDPDALKKLTCTVSWTVKGMKKSESFSTVK